MELTHELPIIKSCHQRDLFLDLQDIQATKQTPNTNLNSKWAILFNNQSYVKKDALFAVKLDPAVLEAQVTVGATQVDGHEELNSTVAASNCNEVTFHNNTAPSPQSNDEFKSLLSMQRAALQSLSSQQFDLLLRYVDTLRKQRLSVQKRMECAFCKKNGHPMTWYSTHSLRDRKGRVRCPILRSFCCRRCGATGDHAHTIKYCPSSEKDKGFNVIHEKDLN